MRKLERKFETCQEAIIRSKFETGKRIDEIMDKGLRLPGVTSPRSMDKSLTELKEKMEDQWSEITKRFEILAEEIALFGGVVNYAQDNEMKEASSEQVYQSH